MNALRIALLIAMLSGWSNTAAAEDDGCVNHYILDRPPCMAALAPFVLRPQVRIWIGDDICPGSCFSPSQVTIEVGDWVTFSMGCDTMICGPHNVVADDGSFRCARGCDGDGEGGNGAPTTFWGPGTVSLQFNTPGVVKFHDEASAATGVIYVMADRGRTVVEFHDPERDHYFITGDPGEQAYVDSGAVGRWQRTGGSFKADGAVPVCRFGGNTFKNFASGMAWGPNSHFFTADAHECDALQKAFHWQRPGWKFESNDFSITAVGPAGCPSHLVPVYRAYNNGFARGVDSNHRITTNLAAYSATLERGWSGEGVVMCALR